MNLILCNGFNYYNRIIKKYDDYVDYYDFMAEGASVLTNINFNPADGVNTSQIVNWDYDTPDYVVCVDENNTIHSRWYVIDSTRTRAGQLKLDLHRDLIVDYYDNIIDSPMFIEKATLQSVNDVAIYNREDIQFNQIKKSETLLKDSTSVPWIIGYMAKNTPDTSISIAQGGTQIYGIYDSDSAFYSAIGYSGGKWRYISDYKLKLYNNTIWNPSLTTSYTGRFEFDIDKGTYKELSTGGFGYDITLYSGYTPTTFNPLLLACLVENYDTIKNKFIALNGATYHLTDLTLDGKYVIINGALKKITLTRTSGTGSNSYNGNSTYGNEVKTIIDNASISSIKTFTKSAYTSLSDTYNYVDSVITLTTESTGTLSTKISSTSNSLIDAPYKMFAIPAEPLKYKYDSSLIGIAKTISKVDAINIAARIGEITGNYIYDIQLLPYCPNFRKYMKVEIDGTTITKYFSIMDLTEGTNFDYIKDSNSNVKGFILYPEISSFSFDLAETGFSCPTSVVDAKIENQCNNYRICSPNYSSMFDFNLVRTGSFTYFNIDCTYKPYSPYIHINPIWGKLYGQDFNDARGLIVQGDFSLPIINDQWKQYQINNKNYLNSFNREIDSIELQNKYAKIGDILGAGASALGSGVSAGITTSSVGLGIASGVTSAAAGIFDIAINEKLRNDALDLRKDQFNYSLQNIQALPNTLARVSAFDVNNKIFPVIEFYSCTDEEKEIFKNKMEYNGMTVGRIDKISSFLSGTKNYIKGQLIRLEGLKECTHEFNAIADELYKGVYI